MTVRVVARRSRLGGIPGCFAARVSPREEKILVGAVRPAWTVDELRDRLAAVGRTPRHVAPLVTSLADADVERARRVADRSRTHRVLTVAAMVAVLVLLLVPDLRRAAFSGGAFGLLCGTAAFLLAYRDRPRLGAAAPGSQAASFAAALLEPTRPTSAIAGRWLAWTEDEDAVVVTQEERWTAAGPTSDVRTRWTPDDGRIVGMDARRGLLRHWVTLHFADGSTLAVDVFRAADRLPEMWNC